MTRQEFMFLSPEQQDLFLMSGQGFSDGGMPSTQTAGSGIGSTVGNITGMAAGQKAGSYLSDLALGSQPQMSMANMTPVPAVSLPGEVNVLSAQQVPLAGAGSYASQASQGISSGLQGAGIGAQTAGGIGSAIGYGVPIATGAYSAYNIGKNLIQGKKDRVGGAMSGAGLGGSIAALAPFAAALGPLGVLALIGGGAALGAGLGSIGHGENYYKGLDRAKSWENTYGKGGVEYSTGQTVTPQDYRKNLELLNYDQSSPTMARDIGAANALSFLTSGKMGDQSAITYANLAKQGVPVAEMFKKAGISGHDEAYGRVLQAVQSGQIDAQTGDILRNGLDQAFGVGAYAKGGKASKSAAPTVRTGRGLPPVPPEVQATAKQMGEAANRLIGRPADQGMALQMGDASSQIVGNTGTPPRGFLLPPIMEAKTPDQLISGRLRVASRK